MTNMTPFKALPTELLIEIFSLVPGTDDPLVAITLASVSARWREVVLSSPTIWQSIFLDNSRPISASTFQILLWLRHSNPLQFDVHLTTSDSTSILPLLSPLLDPERRMRWRYFSLRGPGTREEHFDLSGYSAAPFDILRFCIQDTSNVDWSPSYMRTFTPGNESCGHFAMNIWAPELWVPSPSVILPFPAITIAEVTIPTQPHLLLQFLSACPYLDAFSLAGRLHHDNRPTLPLPVIRLPHLRTLRLVSTCITRSFLSSIDAPSLNALYLGQLNVDFELNNRPAEPEDGDSDDEAQDFSRSHSSDHATGVGLRRLLLRSSPPLKTLIMDWSDMRTKDFAFAFSHLQHLEDFSIEASDLSDRVIELLRPFPSTNGQPPNVRLPYLARLELSNCNEFSGDLLVDVLGARFRITDKPDWAGRTLEEVVISDCLGFSASHANILRMQIGERLQV